MPKESGKPAQKENTWINAAASLSPNGKRPQFLAPTDRGCDRVAVLGAFGFLGDACGAHVTDAEDQECHTPGARKLGEAGGFA